MGKTYGFVDSSSFTSSQFSSIASILEDILDEVDSKIILTDLGPGGVLVARYLKRRYYRNAVLYHIGDKPRVNIANLPTKGGFSSAKECLESVMNSSDSVIKL